MSSEAFSWCGNTCVPFAKSGVASDAGLVLEGVSGSL